MCERVCAGRSVAVSRVVLVGLIGAMASACSTDSVRLSQAFNNPFSASERVAQTTPSAPTNVAAVPTSAVHSQALPPVQTARAAPAPVTSGSGGWMTAGGTRVTVATTDTLNTISQRYGVPASAILTANGLNAGQVTAGRQIVIPVYNASGAADPDRRAAPAGERAQGQAREKSKPAADKPADTKTRVRPGMTSTAAKTEKPAPTKIRRGAGARSQAPRTRQGSRPRRAAAGKGCVGGAGSFPA